MRRFPPPYLRASRGSPLAGWNPAVQRAINLRLDKLRILLRLCHDRRYLSVQQYAYVSAQIDETGKQVGGWLKTL